MSELVCDAYIPQDAETMSISILAMQDIIKDTYFWAHIVLEHTIYLVIQAKTL